MEAAVIEDAITNIIEQVWHVNLGWVIDPAPFGTGALKKEANRSVFVRISGAWNGVVLIRTTQAHSLAIAKRMFKLPPDRSPTKAEQVDCLKETCNVVAGNMKTALPQPCVLFMPHFLEQADPQQELREYDRFLSFAFVCSDEPVIVVLYKQKVGVA